MPGILRRVACLVLSGAAFALVRPSAPVAGGLHSEELGYALPGLRALFGFARPLVLPFFWNAAHGALISGRSADLAAVARWITLVVPESRIAWDVFGWRLAYDFGTAPLTLDEELGRIVAALRWFEQGTRIQRDDTELCLTIATILQDRLGNKDQRSELLGHEWRERFGHDPLQQAREWLAEAGRRGLRHGIGDRLALNAVSLARRAFQRDDLPGALHWTQVAIDGFASEERRGDAESAAWARELREQMVPALTRLVTVPAPGDDERQRLRALLAASRLELR